MSKGNRAAEPYAMVGAHRVDLTTVGDVTALARSHFGSEAPTAIAYCGIDAYLNGEEANFRTFAVAFRMLQN